MTQLSVDRSNVIIPMWKETATDVTVVGGAGGVLWMVFRFLVGAVVADALKDLKQVQKDIAELKQAIHDKDEKMDNLLLAMAER